MSNGIALRVKGKVQGVGFRPFVWQLAHRFGLLGQVSNDSLGVLVHLTSSPKNALFIEALQAECPPLARIERIEESPYQWEQIPTDFIIVKAVAVKWIHKWYLMPRLAKRVLMNCLILKTVVITILLLTAHTVVPVSLL